MTMHVLARLAAEGAGALLLFDGLMRGIVAIRAIRASGGPLAGAVALVAIDSSPAICERHATARGGKTE